MFEGFCRTTKCNEPDLLAFSLKIHISFFYDIWIYSWSHKKHELHLETILDTFRLHQLYDKMSKCQFGNPGLAYLGHLILA